MNAAYSNQNMVKMLSQSSRTFSKCENFTRTDRANFFISNQSLDPSSSENENKFKLMSSHRSASKTVRELGIQESRRIKLPSTYFNSPDASVSKMSEVQPQVASYATPNDNIQIIKKMVSDDNN